MDELEGNALVQFLQGEDDCKDFLGEQMQSVDNDMRRRRSEEGRLRGMSETDTNGAHGDPIEDE